MHLLYQRAELSQICSCSHPAHISIFIHGMNSGSFSSVYGCIQTCGSFVWLQDSCCICLFGHLCPQGNSPKWSIAVNKCYVWANYSLISQKSYLEVEGGFLGQLCRLLSQLCFHCKQTVLRVEWKWAESNPSWWSLALCSICAHHNCSVHLWPGLNMPLVSTSTLGKKSASLVVSKMTLNLRTPSSCIFLKIFLGWIWILPLIDRIVEGEKMVGRETGECGRDWHRLQSIQGSLGRALDYSST